MKTVQVPQNVLARICACAVSYKPSLFNRKVLYFFICFSDHLSLLCQLLSVHNQLSNFVSNSCFISVSVLARIHTCAFAAREEILYIFGPSCPTPKMNSYTMPLGEILYMQLNNATYI